MSREKSAKNNSFPRWYRCDSTCICLNSFTPATPGCQTFSCLSHTANPPLFPLHFSFFFLQFSTLYLISLSSLASNHSYKAFFGSHSLNLVWSFQHFPCFHPTSHPSCPLSLLGRWTKRQRTGSRWRKCVSLWPSTWASACWSSDNTSKWWSSTTSCWRSIKVIHVSVWWSLKQTRKQQNVFWYRNRYMGVYKHSLFSYLWS